MLDSLPKEGYWLTHAEDAEAYEHVFAGRHDIHGAYCERCDRPFHRLLSLDCRDPRLGLHETGVPFVHLVLCFECLPPERAYRLHDDASMSLLEVFSGWVDWLPYPDYPQFFPEQPVSLNPMTPVEQELIRRANANHRDSQFLQEYYPDICDVHPQVGGEPFLIQDYVETSCPLCASTMPLLASLTDDNGSERGFLHNCGCQYLFRICPRCAIVHAEVSCD